MRRIAAKRFAQSMPAGDPAARGAGLAAALREVAASSAAAQTEVARARAGLDRLTAVDAALADVERDPSAESVESLRREANRSSFSDKPIFSAGSVRRLRLEAPDDVTLVERLATAHREIGTLRSRLEATIAANGAAIARLHVQRENLTAARGGGPPETFPEDIARQVASTAREVVLGSPDRARVLRLVEG